MNKQKGEKYCWLAEKILSHSKTAGADFHIRATADANIPIRALTDNFSAWTTSKASIPETAAVPTEKETPKENNTSDI